MRFILWFFAIIGFFTVALLSLVIYFGVHYASRLHIAPKPDLVAKATVLRLDLDREITETPQPFAQFFEEGTPGFNTVLTALKRGAADDRVKGLVARTGGVTLGLGQIQELREAIKAFRAKGKFAYAFGESFGEIGGGTRAYYAASAFDQIWLQPTGSLALVGIQAEIPFFKGTLDKLGVEAQFGRRAEFKSAATQFTETKLPATDREAEGAMLASLYDQIATGIAEGRGMQPEAVKQLIDGGPYTNQAALDKHLIDKIGYRDEIETAARDKAGDGAEMMDVANYVTASPEKETGTEVVALIRAVGEITGGTSDDNPFGSSGKVGADTMVRALNEATKDPKVKAILLRIDSPGGSGTASESIWRAVKQAQAAHKPVIVSMGDVAASGGYYIAAGADKIVADPATLTGSIGVFAGKFVISGLFDKLGVTVDTLSFGHDAGIESDQSEFTPEQKQHFNDMLDDFYHTFVARVAEGRHLDPVKAEALARGRVWTGEQAKERGLVDLLGGFDEAVTQAKLAAQLPADQPVILRTFPRPKSPFDKLVAGLDTMPVQNGQALDLMHHLSGLAPMLHRLDQLDQARR
ncbi:MAG: signal peptide peptidase SppA, partial [Aliidongia sp.]